MTRQIEIKKGKVCDTQYDNGLKEPISNNTSEIAKRIEGFFK